MWKEKLKVYRWNGCDHFAELEFVKNSRLARSVQAHHQDSHFFLACPKKMGMELPLGRI